MPTRTVTETKLADLRLKTDRDLAVLLSRTLDHACQAASEPGVAGAEAAYARAERLLSLLTGLTPLEFQSLETRLRELRAHLDGACLVA